MSLLDRPCWVFDLDGTLTIAKHDFDGLRRRLDLPLGVGVLEAITRLPSDRRDEVAAAVVEWELELAEVAESAPDVEPFLAELQRRQARMGVLTRNTRKAAMTSLERSGLLDYFVPRWVLGRGDALAKPSPDGVERLLREWQVAPGAGVMVGDYRYDIMAGNAAGVATVLVDRLQRLREGHGADRRVEALTELLDG